MITPTCEELLEEDGLDMVHRESDASWRHGTYEYRVYHRVADDTYWSAAFRLSTDGETNELREGTAEINQVVPQQEMVTTYVKAPSAA
jgi:hypothetical protein